MKNKLKLLLLFALSIAIAAGAGCKKESNDDPPKPNPTPVKPEPKPEPKPETDEQKVAQQLYNDALTEIKQSQNYTSAVAKLTQAAEKNIDSANLVLAYMYEYGVGVEQDIAKAKEYYAKETNAHTNEFATLKSEDLSNANNCVVVLPEGCKMKANDFFIDCGDSLTLANGDGTFNTSSQLVSTLTFDGEYVNLCYRHPDSQEKTELNSTETAITLMMCNVPYAFNLSKEAYNKVREQLLDLPETKQLADEIDRQVLEYGHFDMPSLEPILSKGSKAIYQTYGGTLNTKGGSTTQYSGIVEQDGSRLHDYVNDRQCWITENSVKNDITTTFKSGYYDTEQKCWDTELNIRNLSQICFMAYHGTVEDGKFVNKYDTWYDRLFNGTFLPASKFFDLGEGSVTGFLKANCQYIMCVWNRCKSDQYSSSASNISLINDIKTSLEIWADAQKDYREQYLAKEESIKMQICSPYDALYYAYPLVNGSPFSEDVDGPVLAYWLAFYFVLPIWDFVAAYYKAEGKDFKMKNCILKVVGKLLTDKDWITSLQKCISTKNWLDKNAEKLYAKTFWTILECVMESMGDEDKTPKNLTKACKTGVEVAQKIKDGKYDEALTNISKYAEKTIIGLTDNDYLTAVLQTFGSAEDLITFGSGLIKMLFCDYNSFVVRFGVNYMPLKLTYDPIKTVTKDVKNVFKVECNKPGTISIYDNGKLLTSDEETNSLSYDLSLLTLGSHTISIVADFYDVVLSMADQDKSEFECTVLPQVPVLSSTIYGDTPCDVGDDLSVSVSSPIATDISVLVNGVEVGSKVSTKSYSVALPTANPGTFKVVIKGKTKYAEAEDISFSYTVNQPQTPVNTTTIPDLPGEDL